MKMCIYTLLSKTIDKSSLNTISMKTYFKSNENTYISVIKNIDDIIYRKHFDKIHISRFVENHQKR